MVRPVALASFSVRPFSAPKFRFCLFRRKSHRNKIHVVSFLLDFVNLVADDEASVLSKMNAFFDKKMNIIIVTSASVGTLLLVLLLVVVVKLTRNNGKSSNTATEGNKQRQDNQYEHIENTAGTADMTVESGETSCINKAEDYKDSVAMKLTDSNGVCLFKIAYFPYIYRQAAI